MALRDQPYLPLFIQDFLTDEKLAFCSASATGVYIRLMCLMHKSDNYGKILLKQKFKQDTNNIKNFASQLAIQMPYDFVTLTCALEELLDSKVLIKEHDTLIQKRMVKDNNLSELRSKAGRKGGDKSLGKKGKKDIKEEDNKPDFALNFAQAKSKANTEYEYEYESNNIKIDNKVILPKFQNRFLLDISEVEEFLKSEQEWKDVICMQNNLLTEDVDFLIDKFLQLLKGRGEKEKTPKQAKEHFYNWFNSQNGKNKKSSSIDEIGAKIESNVARLVAEDKASQK